MYKFISKRNKCILEQISPHIKLKKTKKISKLNETQQLLTQSCF